MMWVLMVNGVVLAGGRRGCGRGRGLWGGAWGRRRGGGISRWMGELVGGFSMDGELGWGLRLPGNHGCGLFG